MNLKSLSRGVGNRGSMGRRLNSTIARLIAVEIIEGRLQPGEVLPKEATLAEGLNVSRTALRESMRILIAKGFVTSKPRIGATVNDRHMWSILDTDVLEWCMELSTDPAMITALFELRRMVEPATVRLAASRYTADDEMKMREALDTMRSSDNNEDRLEADVAFHSACITAAHNAALIALVPALTAALRWSVTLKVGNSFEMFDKSLQKHEDMMMAILDRDGPTAEQLTTALIDDSLKDTLAVLNEMQLS